MPLTITKQSAHTPVSDARPVRRVVPILALDDNSIDIEILIRCMRGMVPWDVAVTGCETVEAALEAIQKHDFELLFLDYRLQPQSGFEALDQLRSAGFDAPAILMTGMHGEAVLLEAMHAGIADFLPKAALSNRSVQRAVNNAIEKADLAREVSRKSAELQKTVTRLERRQEEIESFYHNVSHELKTPLTGTREFVSLVIDGAVGDISDDQTRLLRAALRGCDQMVSCINDLLDASRLDIGEVALVTESAKLGSILVDVAAEMEQVAAARDVTIAVQLPASDEDVVVDQRRICQVLSNLLSNAIKFSHVGGRIELTLGRRSREEVEVTVLDNGCGIDPEDGPRIFDRLYQSKTQDAATLGGLGMGLYIAREIIEIHGGHLSFVSEPGQGATFTFTLPRCAPLAPMNIHDD